VVDETKLSEDFGGAVKPSLTRAVKRLDRELSGPASNFSEQFLYGHREILIDYAGLDARLAIKGSIEHGWSPFGPSVGIPRFMGGRYLHLAWSSKVMKRIGIPFPQSVVAVGAPFLYLCERVVSHLQKSTLRQRRKFLFLPPHGTEDDSPVVEKLIDEYSKKFDPRESTVQLFWTEFLKPQVRNAYLEVGFEVTTAGFSGVTANEGLGVAVRERAMSTIGGRNLFLLNVLRNLATHSIVVAGSFGTSTLYAGYLNKEVHLLTGWNSYQTVYHDDRDLLLGHRDISDEPFNRFVESQVVPRCFSQGGTSNDNLTTLAKEELGFDDMHSKSSLAKLLNRNSFYIQAKTPVEELKAQIESLW